MFWLFFSPIPPLASPLLRHRECMSTVGWDGADVSLWGLYFIALWAVVVHRSQFPGTAQKRISGCKDLVDGANQAALRRGISSVTFLSDISAADWVREAWQNSFVDIIRERRIKVAVVTMDPIGGANRCLTL